MTAELERTAAEIVRTLSAQLDIVWPGIVSSEAEAQTAAIALRAEGLDGILVAPLVWCEDQVLRSALEGLRGMPLIAWVYLPSPDPGSFLGFEKMLGFSGPVGALQASGMLKRGGWEYRAVVGHARDPGAHREIETHARALMARRALRSARIGVLPFRCDQMSSTWVDEFGLRTRYGVELRYLEVADLARLAGEVGGTDLDAFVARMRTQSQSIEVDERNLGAGVRLAIALHRLCARERLAALAINDVADELHRGLGLRPCLWNPDLSDAGVVVSMEAEVGAAVAMVGLRSFTGETPFYSEPFATDLDRNILLLGHAGYHDARVREAGTVIRVVEDEEYRRADPFAGAVSYFTFRSGPVTIVNSSWTDAGLQWLVAEGRSLTGGPWVAGNCHLACELGVPVPRFYLEAMHAGGTQHWVVIPGHRSRDLEVLCRWTGIGFVGIA